MLQLREHGRLEIAFAASGAPHYHGARPLRPMRAEGSFAPRACRTATMQYLDRDRKAHVKPHHAIVKAAPGFAPAHFSRAWADKPGTAT